MIVSAPKQSQDHAPRVTQGVTALAQPKERNPMSLLEDSLLNILASQVDDLETLRIASENRYRQMTRTDTDKDEKDRGLGLSEDDPEVLRIRASIDGLRELETDAIRHVEKHMRRSPWGPWLKDASGVGEKSLARLLAATGDPYWNTLHDRPRKVSELWSYCGYGDASVQRKRKGMKLNWSPEAKMRAYLCAEATVKQLRAPCHSVKDDKKLVIETIHVEGCSCSPYRLVFDKAKARYAGSTHPAPCDRCTPKGAAPAEVGSPRSGAHIQAMAVREVSKQILLDLWLEAREVYEGVGRAAA